MEIIFYVVLVWAVIATIWAYTEHESANEWEKACREARHEGDVYREEMVRQRDRLNRIAKIVHGK